jgi:TIR domain
MSGTDAKLRLLVRHSASPKDVTLAEELLGHLRPLQRFAGIEVWSEDRIRPGDDWRSETRKAIDQADVVLVLLSADFLATDRLLDEEVPQLLERVQAGKLRVIPVVLRSCLLEVHPWLEALKPLPRGAKALGSFSGDARDEVLTSVVKEIVDLATSTAATGAPPPASTPAKAEGGAPPSPSPYYYYVSQDEVDAISHGLPALAHPASTPAVTPSGSPAPHLPRKTRREDYAEKVTRIVAELRPATFQWTFPARNDGDTPLFSVSGDFRVCRLDRQDRIVHLEHCTEMASLVLFCSLRNFAEELVRDGKFRLTSKQYAFLKGHLSLPMEATFYLQGRDGDGRFLGSPLCLLLLTPSRQIDVTKRAPGYRG